MVQERSIEGVGDGMVEGGAALGMGIYRGFTGLVTKPVEGAKSKGVGGIHCLCCNTKNTMQPASVMQASTAPCRL